MSIEERRGVLLGRKVRYSDLEEALIGAAQEVGWRVDINSETRKYYDITNLGNPVETETKELFVISQPAGYMPMVKMTISVYDIVKPARFYFDISHIIGLTPEEEINKYLRAVATLLNK